MGGHSAVRVITWSLTMGMAFKTTPPFFARASEKKLVQLWTSQGRLKLPIGYSLLTDKGFGGTAGMYPNFNTILTPAFLKVALA